MDVRKMLQAMPRWYADEKAGTDCLPNAHASKQRHYKDSESRWGVCSSGNWKVLSPLSWPPWHTWSMSHSCSSTGLPCHVLWLRCYSTAGFSICTYVFQTSCSPLIRVGERKKFFLFHISNKLQIEVAEIKVARNMKNVFVKTSEKSNRCEFWI